MHERCREQRVEVRFDVGPVRAQRCARRSKSIRGIIKRSNRRRLVDRAPRFCGGLRAHAAPHEGETSCERIALVVFSSGCSSVLRLGPSVAAGGLRISEHGGGRSSASTAAANVRVSKPGLAWS